MGDLDIVESADKGMNQSIWHGTIRDFSWV